MPTNSGWSRKNTDVTSHHSSSPTEASTDPMCSMSPSRTVSMRYLLPMSAENPQRTSGSTTRCWRSADRANCPASARSYTWSAIARRIVPSPTGSRSRSELRTESATKRMQRDTVGEWLGERSIGQPLVALVSVGAGLHRLQQFGSGDPCNRGDAQRPIAVGIDLVAEEPGRQVRHRSARTRLRTDRHRERRAARLAHERLGRLDRDPVGDRDRTQFVHREPIERHRLEHRLPSAFEPATRRPLSRGEHDARRCGQSRNHHVA